MKNLNDIFIKKTIDVHNEIYNYSLVHYINNYTKVKIICKKHGIFEQTPKNHLKGQGCPKCKQKYTSMNKEQLILKLNDIHKNKYNYLLNTEDFNSRTDLKIRCSTHGIFIQPLYVHIKGHGCPKCNGGVISNKKEFIKKSDVIHHNKYDYSLSEYKNALTKIKIICKKHGIFEQTPNKHLLGRGCPKCNMSKGENMIKKYLDNEKMVYFQQKTFDDCKFKKKLKFDFYLPEYNICVEYDGEQHFERYRFEKDDNKLNIRKLRDQIKTKYCEKNNIKLIRIKSNNINDLNKLLKIKQ